MRLTRKIGEKSEVAAEKKRVDFANVLSICLLQGDRMAHLVNRNFNGMQTAADDDGGENHRRVDRKIDS